MRDISSVDGKNRQGIEDFVTSRLSSKIAFMPTVINYILSMLLGPRAAQGINALRATFNLPALVHLVETLSMIESGIRPTLTDDEIRRGLEEFRSILDLGIDNRTNLAEWQKEMQKNGNAYLVNGCYGEILCMLGRIGYSIRINH